MNHTRRAFLERLGGTGLVAALWPTSARAGAGAGDATPDFGPNVVIVDPAMPAAAVQARVDSIFRQQERAHFTDARHAILFRPGRYTVDVNVGFFTQVAGLGRLPGDVTIDEHVHAEADWAKGMALVNFWRGVENLSIRPADGADRWAVSQAAPYRRVHLHGDLALDDGGWSSGGFMADCRIDGTVRSGTQQQWFTRNSHIGGWQGANWNMMFAGVAGAPRSSFPAPPYTSLPTVPVVREKPFLCVTDRGEWAVTVPGLRHDTRGPGWWAGAPRGKSIPLARFLIARPETPVSTINAALAAGRHLLLTPGVYRIDEPLRIEHADTVVLGLGLATLMAEKGSAAIVVADVPGVAIAGLLIDAGPVETPILVVVGPRGATRDHRRNPTLLADLFFRVGGATIGKAQTCLEINSHHVIGDHLWIWRADHGDRNGGRVHVGWAESTADHGLIVNGDDVTIHGLFVEHFQKYQVLWNGERGRTHFFQCELPYDPPSQAAYMAGKTRGWAAYKVADTVTTHAATGLGIYANFTADPTIVLESAIEAPRRPGVTFASITTISLGTGQGTIAHLSTASAPPPGPVRFARRWRSIHDEKSHMMILLLLAAQATTLGATNYAADAPMAAPRGTPSFADEFDGTAIDQRKWRYDTSRNAQGWYNNERQYYAQDRAENARIDKGVLVIEARRETLDKTRFADWGGQAYTSAKLVSRTPRGPGFYEVRAKLPCGRGSWPAIWLLPSGGRWPDEGEIDIMEMVGWDAGTVHATLHTAAFNHVKGTQRGAQSRVATACTAYHRYQLDWRAESITIGIDGRAIMRVVNDQPGGKAAWPFTRPYELILNLAVGGDWGGQKGIDDAAFPQRMTVDYVRYWRR